jgi:hypothetical protein
MCVLIAAAAVTREGDAMKIGAQEKKKKAWRRGREGGREGKGRRGRLLQLCDSLNKE